MSLNKEVEMKIRNLVYAYQFGLIDAFEYFELIRGVYDDGL